MAIFGNTVDSEKLTPMTDEQRARLICHTLDFAKSDKEIVIDLGQMIGFLVPPEAPKVILLDNPDSVRVIQECDTCGKRMRPRSLKRVEGDGLVTQGCRGLCQLCYKKVRKAEMEADDKPRKYGKPRPRKALEL